MRNCSPLDRAIRLSLGLLILALTVYGNRVGIDFGRAVYEVGAVGVLLVLTGLVGISPAYMAFGYSTVRHG